MSSEFTALVSDIVERSEKILLETPLCSRCLGRLFAKYGLGLSNQDRGLMIKTLLALKIFTEYSRGESSRRNHYMLALNGGDQLASSYMKIYGEEISPLSCYICGGKFTGSFIQEVSEKACEILREHDASSFLIGVVVDEEISRRELDLLVKYGLESMESIKRELKREIGKKVAENCGLTPNFTNPDVVVVVKIERDFTYSITSESNPVFISGRYWKLGRNISHVPWITRSGFKKYPVSIQEFVGEALRSIYQSEDVVIHAAGREDVDARMIGSGRPLIIEIKKPVKRSIGIEEANKALRELSRRYPIVVELFSRTTRSSKVFVKNEAKLRRKVYRVAVYSPEEILPQDLVKLEEFFSNREVKQRTPTRILRRKKDREKTKRVYAVRIVQVSRRVFESLIYCDGGLYVKELIHGDYGRTVPSFAEVVGKPLIPIELDVVLVED